MLLQLSIGLVLVGSLVLLLVLLKNRRLLDLATRAALALTLLGLISGAGVTLQQHWNDQRDAENDARDDQLQLGYNDTTGEILRLLLRPDLTTAERRARLQVHLARYNRIRSEMARRAAQPAPPPLDLPQAVPDAGAPATADTGASPPAAPAGEQPVEGTGSDGGGGAATSVPPPPPPPPPPF